MFKNSVRIRSFDIAFLLFNIWTLLAFALHPAPNAGGVVYGGSLVVESFGAYLITRAYVRDKGTFYATVSMFTVTVLIAGLIALPETLLGRHFVHEFLQSQFGGTPLTLETRLGLTRAASVFDHPIHLGTYCAGLVAMVWYGERRISKRALTLCIMARGHLRVTVIRATALPRSANRADYHRMGHPQRQRPRAPGLRLARRPLPRPLHFRHPLTNNHPRNQP